MCSLSPSRERSKYMRHFQLGHGENIHMFIFSWYSYFLLYVFDKGFKPSYMYVRLFLSLNL